jgi:hypothetical protein
VGIRVFLRNLRYSAKKYAWLRARRDPADETPPPKADESKVAAVPVKKSRRRMIELTLMAGENAESTAGHASV